MLITNLLPLLARYSLGFDLVAGPDDIVTLTVIPRRQEGATHKLETAEAARTAAAEAAKAKAATPKTPAPASPAKAPNPAAPPADATADEPASLWD